MFKLITAPNQDHIIHLLRGGYYNMDTFRMFSASVRHCFRLQREPLDMIEVQLSVTSAVVIEHVTKCQDR